MSQRTPVHALSMFWCYIDGFYLGLFRTSNAHVLAYAVIIEFFFLRVQMKVLQLSSTFRGSSFIISGRAV